MSENSKIKLYAVGLRIPLLNVLDELRLVFSFLIVRLLYMRAHAL